MICWLDDPTMKTTLLCVFLEKKQKRFSRDTPAFSKLQVWEAQSSLNSLSKEMTVKPSTHVWKQTQELQLWGSFPSERRRWRQLCRRRPAVRLQKEKERDLSTSVIDWLMENRSGFGLVSDQAAINQRAEEREACGEGRRREDKRSEWTDRINSWPRGSAPRLARSVMKRCHLRSGRPLNWSVLMKVSSDGGTACLQSYVTGPRRPAAKSLRGKNTFA